MILPLLASAQAATYYVATSGSDSNPGTASAPFQHVSKGVSAATNPGDTVIVENGTYGNEGVGPGNYVVTLYSSGTAGNPITIMAQNRGQAILDAGNTNNQTCNGASSYFNLYNAAYIVIQGFVLQNSCDGGFISNDAAHDVTIRWNEIRNIGNWYITDQYGRDGIYLNNSEYNFTFDGNIFHNIGRTGGASNSLDHGIYAHASNLTIINNVFYNFNTGWSIQIADGAANWLIANNTFAFPDAGGQDGQIMFWNGNSNIQLTNNIFYEPAGSALTQYSATITAEFDHNLVYGTSTVMDNGGAGVSVGSGNVMGQNPMFMSTSSPYNFALQSGSPAIGAATGLSQVLDDIMGTTRPSSGDAIGAYQGSGGSSGSSGPTGSSGSGGSPTPPPVVSAPTISGVSVSSITSTSAVVNWTTSDAASSTVYYGTTSYNLLANGPGLVTTHSVTLTGLSPSSSYGFQVMSQDSNGQTMTASSSFTTLATPTTFSLSGGSVSIKQGQSASVTLTATLLTGASAVVSFSAGQVAGLTATFAAPSCAITCTDTLTVAAASTLAAGTYNLVVTGSGAGGSASATIPVTVSSTMTNAPTSGNATAGLVAHWLLNESSGTVAHDSSGYGNNGAVYNGYWWTSVHGPTLYFSGPGSYVDVPESPSLEMTRALTVAFWLDPNPNTVTDPRVIAKVFDWDVKLNGANRNPQFDGPNGQYAMTNFSPPFYAWHHIAFTYAAGTVKAYVDGVAVPLVQNTFTGRGILTSNQNGLYIGLDSDLASPFVGNLQDVRIYNRALSPADILAVYQSTY